MSRAPETPEVNVAEENAVAATRSLIYAELAGAFRDPSDPAAAQSLADGSLERELIGLMDGLARRLPGYATSPLRVEAHAPNAAADAAPHAAPDGVDVLYCSLFEAAIGATTVSLYERDHGPMRREPLWEDLFRCYAHFGLELASGGLREAPDHLTIELEFMHFLAFLEASNSETARGVVLGQRDFLARHLAKWAPELYPPLAERSTGSVYHRIAGLLRDFVSADRAYLESRTLEPRSCTHDAHSAV